ncbi:unnamed protein product [Adineta steineri]|uniref:JmjC domain-containing protein n=1 Tax=Adineta steineri TaxID=433720 RepID=A0A814HK19_9BILA|nr:unnamed protein product [Adineta steineri]
MSSIWMDVPTLQVNENQLQNFVSFIYKNEQILKEFGAMKIQLNDSCKLSLKKRRNNLILVPNNEQIVKINSDENIYSLHEVDHIDEPIQQSSLMIDEHDFWSSLSSSSNKQRFTNTSTLPNKSFFQKKIHPSHFNIHRLPEQSLLQLGGNKVTQQFVPCIKRAHGPGSISQMTTAKQHLFSIDYHHEGGARHWYIIPHYQRKSLQKIINRHNSSCCLDHGQILIDPSVLDNNRIRYHRIIQRSNELVVISAGTLTQSFTENANWSESIEFALPSWIEDGHANASISSCRCNAFQDSSRNVIDITLFRHELIQKYITFNLSNITDDKSISLKDDKNMDMDTISTQNTTTINSSNVENMMQTNEELIIPLEPIVPPSQSSSTTWVTPSISSYFSEEDKNKSVDNNAQLQYEVLE